jgi:predicted transcriptional regulator of viral defense system
MAAESEPTVRNTHQRSFTFGCLELAASQHGVASLEQLTALGMTSRGIQLRARQGLLHRRYDGVYAIGSAQLSADGERFAAVLASGAGAALGRRSAAALWEIRSSSATRIEVITTRRGRRPRAGIVLCTTRNLAPEDVTTCRGIPVTTVSRTLLDLARVLSPAALAKAVHEAEILRLLDVAEIERAIERAGAVPGRARLRAAITEPATGVTRRELEKRFVALCRRSGVRLPRTNVFVRAGDRLIEVDALWPDERLVVELDGAAVHHTRRAFHEDRLKDSALAAAGYLVVRFTWQRVTRDAESAVRELRAILAQREAI